MITKFEAILSLLPNAKISGSDNDIKWLGTNGQWDGVPEVTAEQITSEQSRLHAEAAFAKVKVEVKRRILMRLPGATPGNYRDKELNYIARHAELSAIESGMYRDANGVLQPARALTPSEITEVSTFSAFWGWVKANRTASNLVEADWKAVGYAESFDYVNSPRWPV